MRGGPINLTTGRKPLPGDTCWIVIIIEIKRNCNRLTIRLGPYYNRHLLSGGEIESEPLRRKHVGHGLLELLDVAHGGVDVYGFLLILLAGDRGEE